MSSTSGGRSASKISRLERGLHDFKEKDVQLLLDVYGITEPSERERLLDMGRQANVRGWWEAFGDVSTKALQTYVSLEDIAQRIRSYENEQLLGLLQIPDYTRHLVSTNSPEKSKQEIDRIVELREMRQERFMHESSAQLICVLDEATLVRGYGSKAIMRRQLEHLITLADHERVSFSLIELSRLNAPVQIGTTTIFDFEDGQLPDVVYIERPNAGQYLEEADAVDEYVKRFDRLLIASVRSTSCVRRLQHHRNKYQ